jgi:aminomethyltransferase
MLNDIKYYHFTTGTVDEPNHLSHGYTGEDGFEVCAAADKGEQLWNKMLEVGKSELKLACSRGLAARNTLRLEAGMSLYGHEIDETTTLPRQTSVGFVN